MAITTVFYAQGVARMTPSGWDARADDELLLIEYGTGWTFNEDHVSLTSLVLGTTELTATNYVRKPLVSGTPAWSASRWSLPTSSVVWTSLGTAEGIHAVIGYQAGIDDANSVPLFAVYDPAPAAIATLDGSNLTVTLDLGASG